MNVLNLTCLLIFFVQCTKQSSRQDDHNNIIKLCKQFINSDFMFNTVKKMG